MRPGMAEAEGDVSLRPSLASVTYDARCTAERLHHTRFRIHKVSDPVIGQIAHDRVVVHAKCAIRPGEHAKERTGSRKLNSVGC